jgi:uncharacterized damage-inducible protein DinB
MTAFAPIITFQQVQRLDTESATPPAALALISVFEQLADLLMHTSDEQYTQAPVGFVTSSLGGHYRHNLDHVSSLLEAMKTGELNYDHRSRGTVIETSRLAALHAIRRLQRLLLDMDEAKLDHRLELRTMIDVSQQPLMMSTTVARELAFVLSHTIHHNAIIGVMARTLGIPLPDRFGYAPATIAYQEKQACAR